MITIAKIIPPRKLLGTLAGILKKNIFEKLNVEKFRIKYMEIVKGVYSSGK